MSHRRFIMTLLLIATFIAISVLGLAVVYWADRPQPVELHISTERI